MRTSSRPGWPGRNKSGLESVNACEMPEKAPSAPAFCCTVTTPMRLPSVGAETRRPCSGDAFLPGDDRTNAGFGDCVEDRREGEAKNLLDPFALENLRDRLAALHQNPP